MSYETIMFEVDRGIARLTLNRPEKLNSFNAAMHEEVRHALRQLTGCAARVLVLTGAGRGFCAGQDLGDRAVAPGAEPPDLGDSIENNYKPLVLALAALPMPVIAAVNGVAAGAGASLALAGDLVIAARSASFLQLFAPKLGLIPDLGSTYFLPRSVGTARAKGLALLGDALGAEDAARWGLIWEVVDDAALDATVEALARRLANGPSRAYAEIKAVFNGRGAGSLDEQLALEARAQATLADTADFVEGLTAFHAKRTPRFDGR